MIFRLILHIPISKLCYFIFFLTLSCYLSFSQNSQDEDPLINSYIKYFNAPREIAYAHLNKSIYIKGETLAFNAYVFDKNYKGLSKPTTNLYCTISDENGKTIKSKMLKVTDGIAYGVFYVDSLFSSGNYIFKAYTSYMKNFDEQNYYIENIKVVDLDIDNGVYPKVISSVLDAQFLPEGGHLVANVENTTGIIIKDSLGFGVPNVNGHILNSRGQEINVFKTNQFGIGRFSYTPKDYNSYKVKFNFEGEDQIFDLPKAEPFGIALTLSNINNKITLRLLTNDKTFPEVRGKPYKLAIHNGKSLNIIYVEFEDGPIIIKGINYNDLFAGINIFTLFNEKNEPLLERLLFKYDGVNFLKSNSVTYNRKKDSTEVILSFKDIDTSLINKFSLSILPEETKSYNHHQNIISSFYLQPYVKSYIENASWYFTNVDRRKQYELDNLLITQGWSSYDWNAIFNYSPNAIYPFETGVSFKATVNTNDSNQFVMYPNLFNKMETFEISKDNNTFEKNGLILYDEEKIRISEVNKNNKLKRSGIYLQFSPLKIPDLEKHIKVLPLKEQVYFDSNLSQPLIESSWTEYEQLDEVLIEVNKEKERIEKIKNTAFGRVDVFDTSKRRMYIDLASYLSAQGYQVNQANGTLRVYNQASNSFGTQGSPLFYIDNRLVADYGELAFYDLDIVDYIIINKRGLSEGLRGANGVIKIFTDPTIAFKENPQISKFQEFEIPLTFSKPTKFYAPKYSYYQTKFFNEYGVIEWLPNMSVDENGNISFKISNHSGNNIKLFIEGTANNGSFISEVKTVNFD